MRFRKGFWYFRDVSIVWLCGVCFYFKEVPVSVAETWFRCSKMAISVILDT